MHPDAIGLLAALAGRHWWFRSRASFVGAWGGPLAALPAGSRVLNLGAGPGSFDLPRRRAWRVVCADRDTAAIERLRGRAGHLPVRCDAQALPVVTGSCDGVLVGDLLYHRAVEDPDAVLGEAFRALRPGGWILLWECAFESLRGGHDRFFHAARRFRLEDLRRRVRRAGFRTIDGGYAFAACFPGAWLRRRLSREGEDPDFGGIPPTIQEGLVFWHRFEAVLSRVIPFLFGTSVLVRGRKP